MGTTYGRNSDARVAPGLFAVSACLVPDGSAKVSLTVTAALFTLKVEFRGGH
jgi:hypothetical protein